MLEAKVAIITGASSGIGKATAIEFAKNGAYLSLGGRNKDRLEETKNLCVEAGIDADKIQLNIGDVCSQEYLEQTVNQTIKKFGKLDILVNNAGIMQNGMPSTTSTSQLDKLMDVNVKSVIALSQLCVPHLIKSQGSIVNVTSVAGICSFAQSTYYCMSKTALNCYTKCLALELADKQVRVNAVCPTVTVTSLFDGMKELDKFLDACAQVHPLKRVAQPEEIAKPIVFLASDQSSFITGQAIAIDGARSLVVPRPNIL